MHLLLISRSVCPLCSEQYMLSDVALALPSSCASERIADVSCRTSCVCMDMPMFWHSGEKGKACVYKFSKVFLGY